MSTINDLPNPSTFGEEFNYAVWVPNSTIQFCNVPWNSDYRDIVNFNTQTDLANYCASRMIYEVGQMTYLKLNKSVRLNVPFNQLLGANYIRVINPAQPVSGTYTDSHNVTHTVSDVSRDLYYFVTSINYLAPNTTELELQLDVWQTFRWNVQFGQCYIERGHIGVANEKALDNTGRDYLTVPEGLDIGGEYRFLPVLWSQYATPDSGVNVLVVTTTDFTASPGSVASPNLNTASGSVVNGVPTGADYWTLSTTDFSKLTTYLAQYPWVAQGIIGIYLIPDVHLDGTITSIGSPPINALHVKDFNSFAVNTVTVDRTSLPTNPPPAANWRDDIMQYYPARYSHLRKFLTAPYTILEYTTYSGTALVVKPEGLPAVNDIKVHILFNLVMPNGRMAFIPESYNSYDGSDTFNSFASEWLDAMCVIANFPSTSIVNSGAIQWMAANHANLSYSQQSANWAQQKALAGNQQSANVATLGINQVLGAAAISVDAANQMTDLAMHMQAGHGILGAIQNGVQGFAEGGPIGALAGVAGSAANTGMAMYQTGQSNEIQRSLMQQQANLSAQTGANIRDSNKAYADYAANGDYANAIAGIQAQVQSAQMIQPSVVGQVGGDTFQYGYQGFQISVKPKIPQLAHIRAVGEFWLRYGYAVQQFATPPASLACMSNFTYWKMRETYLIGSTLPEFFKQTIRGIFEKGVTVWQNPADIGTIDMGINTPLSGIVLP